MCPACAEVVEEQLEIAYDLPNVRLYRCTVCGTLRSVHPGRRTCCQVCVNTPGLRAHLRTRFERQNEAMVRAKLDEHAWPGWQVLACDIYGLPFDPERDKSKSQGGTWGRHEPCGTIQRLDDGRPECQACPPEPGSRTNRARAPEPTLLYLVRYWDWQKYGIGTRRRLREQVAGGAELLQVLQARHDEAWAAETTLKRQHASVAVGRVAGLPESFEAGTEVVPATVPIDLRTVLPNGEPFPD